MTHTFLCRINCSYYVVEYAAVVAAGVLLLITVKCNKCVQMTHACIAEYKQQIWSQECNALTPAHFSSEVLAVVGHSIVINIMLTLLY